MQDQYVTVLNTINADTSVTTSSFSVSDGVKIGSIMIETNGTFNGTTSTCALQGSNDNVVFAAVLQDDNSTAMLFTLGAASSTYTFELKSVVYKFYKLAYLKGDASAGTVAANFIGKI